MLYKELCGMKVHVNLPSIL